MARLSGILAWVFFALALLLFAFAGTEYFGVTNIEGYFRRPEPLPYTVDAVVKSFGEKRAGEEVSVPFTIKNISKEPIRICGSSFC